MSTLLDVVAHFETSIVDPIDENSSTMELESVTTPHGDIPDGTYGLTLEHNSNSKREYVVGTLDSSTKTFTFTKRDVSVLDATTEDASGDNDRQTHRKGSNIRFTNHPALQRITRVLYGDDQLDTTKRITYSGSVTPTNDNELVTKAYVLSIITGGAITYESQTLTADAGESISQGDYVYLKESDGKWYKVDATDTSTLNGVLKGIAQGSGTNNSAISNGVIIYGLDDTQTYTAGQAYYASDTAGGISTTAGTNEHLIGYGDLNQKLVLFDNYTITKDEKDALVGNSGTPSSTNTFVTESGINTIGAFGDGSDGDATISSETTLTRDMYYDNLTVNSTLITDGYRIFVKGTLSGTGTIKYPDAQAGANGVDWVSGGAHGAGGASEGNGFFPNRAGTDGNAAADQGGGLGNPGGAAGQAGGQSTPDAPENNVGIPFAEGFNYGLGISPVWGLDMQDDGTVAVYKAPSGGRGGQVGEMVSQSGSGTQGGPGGAGGGGASGGVVWIAAKNWEGTFTIRAIGGDGGDAGDSQNGYYDVGETTAGAGGAGGVAVIFYQNKTWTGSYNLAGGSKGADDGGTFDTARTSNTEAGPTGVSYEINL